MKAFVDQPVITVVIPTFNRLERLKGALDSVLSETRVPIRVHVFDNHSTDGTEAFLAQSMLDDDRISVTRQPANIGSTRNYIDAFSHVQTAFFVPLADDDRLLPDFLHAAYGLLVAAPEACAAAFFAPCMNDDGKVLYLQPHADAGTPTGLLTPAQSMRELLLRGHYLWSAVLWRSQVLEHIGHPYFHTGLPSDLDFQIQVFSKFPIVLTRELGAVYTQHAGQHSNIYSMRDIPSFAKLAARMDRTTRHLFSADEYAVLRRTFLDRYKQTWGIKPAEPIEPQKAMQMAALAIGRLGDRDVAVKLSQAYGPSGAATETSLLGNMVRQVVDTQAELDEIKHAWLEQPLGFRRVAFVRIDAASGALHERNSNMFKLGEAMVVYAEPVGHLCRRGSDGTYESGLNVDLTVKSATGQTLIEQQDFKKTNFSSKLRKHQATIVLTLTLTAAPVGEYLLQYTFRDTASEKTGMLSLPIVLQAG